MKKFLLAALVMMSGARYCHAVPQLLNFQGRISESDHQTEGQRDMTFRIFNTAAGGAPLFAEAHAGPDAVTVDDGVFNVLIGGLTPGGVPLAVFDGSEKFIEVQVGRDVLPRQRITSVGYAFRSAVADQAQGLVGVAGSTPVVAGLIVNTIVATSAVVAGNLNVSIGADGVYTSAANNSITFTQPSGSPAPELRTSVAGQQNNTSESGSTPMNINAGVGGALNLNPVSTGPVNVGVGGVNVNGSVTASTYFGDGSHLTGVGGGAPHGQQLFTASGNFTIPAGVASVTLMGSAGGGRRRRRFRH